MKRLITNDVFMTIFSNLEYRRKLDKIILNFFGLETNNRMNIHDITKEDITLEFILMINTEEVLRILVKDVKKLFSMSKKFYINISLHEINKYHVLRMPCYWEVYAPFCFHHLKKKPKIILIAALLYCKNVHEVKTILKKINTFNNKEIKNILKTIEKNNMFL